MASVDLEEKANFTRLSRLLVDKGTEALRNTFDAIHPPPNLPAVLNANQKSLSKLRFRVINNSQWDLLFPASGARPDSKTFDVTLLTVLLRNIPGFTPPTTGWNAMPPGTDRSMEANIIRIKFLRNEVYAHVTSTQVDNTTFKSLWRKISRILVELKIPQNDVDDLKTCPLGPEEAKYVEMLRDWESKEEECVKMLECTINRLTQVTDNLKKKCTQESDEDPLRKLAKHNFKGKIKRKVEFFHPGTRDWLLHKVGQFVEKEQKSRILLLTAGPGFGKSVFAAKVCEDFEMKGKLAACHFCDFSDSNLSDPMMMVQSLASQMCENIAGFKEKLLGHLGRPHQVRNLKDAFRIYLQNPLDELDLKETSLVVIDGLDESATDNKNEIVDLIAAYFPELPECIKVLVTSRPEISVAKLDSVEKPINIANDDTNNNDDLERYLKACLTSLPGRILQNSANTRFRSLAESDVFEVLALKCNGSFLYAFYLQSELLKRDDLTFEEMINFLPEGLNSVYQNYFKRLEEELIALTHKNIDVFRILEMLPASEGCLPLSFVSQALGLVPDCRGTKNVINKVNETVSCLLYVSDDLVTVFHKSVIDWLLAEGYKDHEYTVNVSDGHKLLWPMCEKVFKEIKNSCRSEHDLTLTNDMAYALYYGPQHLVACKMKESFFWLVDVVIVHTLLTAQVDRKGNYVRLIFNVWVRILQDAVVGGEFFIDDKLRAQISWHVTEIDYMDRRVNEIEYMATGQYPKSLPFCYLQSVLAHSPEDYFSDDEKKTAELLLSRVRQFVKFNFGEADVMPLAVWRFPSAEIGGSFVPSAPKFRAVGLSYDKTMAAVAQRNGTIILMSVPCLVELWHFSTEYKSISCCTFVPNGPFVLFGKLETVLNVAERKEVPFFHGNKETFTSCSFSPNGKRLVTSDGSDTVKLWDVAKQNLLSSLYSGNFRVNWCSFDSTGLFITADWIDGLHEEPKSDVKDFTNEDSHSYHSEDSEYSVVSTPQFCKWNAITWQRSDERGLLNIRLDDRKVFHSELCRHCFQPGYSGVGCIFELDGEYLYVRERTHFSTLIVWNFFVHILKPHEYCYFREITAIKDDIWFYADVEKLIVFKTKAPTQQFSCLPSPTWVISSSFSPDGSRLATCTSDGYVNIWNVYTKQIEQRFKCNQGDSSFTCWWSEKFLFVFSFFGRIPSLSKYPFGVNLKILVTKSQEVSLSHFVPLSAIVDFSEGLLIFEFECGKTKLVKVLDVGGAGGPQMVMLSGIEPRMSITVSPGASFVFGANEYEYYIWKRNAKEEPAVYEVFIFNEPSHTLSSIIRCIADEMSFEEHEFFCYFSNDSKHAVVLDWSAMNESKIFDLDTGDYQSVVFGTCCNQLFCLNKDKVVVIAQHQMLKFFDMDSGALLESSFERYLTSDSAEEMKLSPNDTVLAFPKINGDMEFLRLCIPQSSVLSSIKHKAAIKKRKQRE